MRLPCLMRKVSDETTAFASEHVIHHSEPHLVCTIREPPTLENVHYTSHKTTLLETSVVITLKTPRLSVFVGLRWRIADGNFTVIFPVTTEPPRYSYEVP
ncbi:hypothetical protein IG631_10679 [Alternaria alternata]|nr:hypothetical protein IG631_10679 [Alternaria alternata]